MPFYWQCTVLERKCLPLNPIIRSSIQTFWDSLRKKIIWMSTFNLDMQGRNLIFIIILRNISKRHVLPRQSDSFEMIKLSCNHLRGFEHELMAQRLFPFRIIDIYWKKYQRLPSSENFSFGVWRMVITWLKNTFLVRGIARIIVITIVFIIEHVEYVIFNAILYFCKDFVRTILAILLHIINGFWVVTKNVQFYHMFYF